MKRWILTVVWIAGLICLVVNVNGCCGEWQKKFIDANNEVIKLKEQLANTPTQIIYKTVAKQDWLVTLSIIGIGISVFAFLSGHLWGLKSIAALWSVLSTVLMLQRFAVWIAVISLAGAVGIMAFVIWQNRKVLTEIVMGGERFKTVFSGVTNSNTVELFKDAHNTEQSNTTKKVVEQVQKKLNGNGGVK